MSAASQCRLEALPAEVCGLQRLQRLDVSGNALPALPAAVAQLTSLRSLAARQNRLAALPPELGACSALQVHKGIAGSCRVLGLGSPHDCAGGPVFHGLPPRELVFLRSKSGSSTPTGLPVTMSLAGLWAAFVDNSMPMALCAGAGCAAKPAA